MDYPNCRLFGFDKTAINNVLRLLDLHDQDHDTAAILHSEVIDPHINDIVEDFYAYLQQHEEYKAFFSTGEQLNMMVQAQVNYMSGLGINFHSPDYFEHRLKIGITHHRIGLTPNLYEFAYRKISDLIIDKIPDEMDSQTISRTRKFLGKIVALDMALALESYHQLSIGRLENSITELEQTSDKLKQRSSIDSLTGALERSTAIARINNLLSAYMESGEKFSVVMCDINGLHNVNDKYGHMAGDLVLKNFVSSVKTRIRSMDSVGRYGGDLFLFLFPGTGEASASRVVEDIKQHLLDNPIKIGEKEFTIDLLAAVSEVQDKDDLPALLERVDRMLVQAGK